MRVTKYWHRLPREVAESPPWDLQEPPGRGAGHLALGTLPGRAVQAVPAASLNTCGGEVLVAPVGCVTHATRGNRSSVGCGISKQSLPTQSQEMRLFGNSRTKCV